MRTSTVIKINSVLVVIFVLCSGFILDINCQIISNKTEPKHLNSTGSNGSIGKEINSTSFISTEADTTHSDYETKNSVGDTSSELEYEYSNITDEVDQHKTTEIPITNYKQRPLLTTIEVPKTTTEKQTILASIKDIVTSFTTEADTKLLNYETSTSVNDTPPMSTNSTDNHIYNAEPYKTENNSTTTEVTNTKDTLKPRTTTEISYTTTTKFPSPTTTEIPSTNTTETPTTTTTELPSPTTTETPSPTRTETPSPTTTETATTTTTNIPSTTTTEIPTTTTTEFPSTITTQTPISSPGPCSNVTVSEITARSIKVTWGEPLEPNGPIDGYVITIKSPGTNMKNQTIFNQTYHKFDGLKPYKNYTIELYAFNNYLNDTKLMGIVTKMYVDTLADDPGLCDKVIVSAITARSIEVTWEKPSEPNGPIDGYVISIKPSGTNLKNATILNQTFHNFVDLKPYMNYTIELYAFNKDSNGTQLMGNVTKIIVETLVDSPGKCNNVIASDITSTSINVTWEEPSEPNGPIDGYVITIKTPGTNLENATILNQTFHNFDDLKPYKNYTIELYAFNKDSNDTQLMGNVTKLIVSTPVDDPSPIEQVNITTISSNLLEIQWSVPEEPNGPLDGVEITCMHLENNTEEIIILPKWTNSYNLTGLKPYTYYNITLRTFNQGDTNDTRLWSKTTSISDRTLSSEPEQCQYFNTTDIGPYSLTVIWGEPIVKNGPINGFIIKWWNSETKYLAIVNDSTIATYQITNLKPYSDYNVSIMAFNYAEDGIGGVKLEENILEGEMIEITAKTDVSAPSEPLYIATDFNNSTKLITVTWEEPQTKNGPIEAYEIMWRQDEWKPGDSRDLPWKRSVINETSHEFIAQYWRSYSIVVNAFNINRKGQMQIGNATFENITTPYGKPLKPTNVTATTISDSSINVTWYVPLPLTGPTWYKILVTESAGNVDKNCYLKMSFAPSWTIDVLLWNTNHKVIEKLKPFKCYGIVVTAIVGETGDLKTDSTNPAATQTLDGIPPMPTSPLKFLTRNQTSVGFFIPTNVLSNSNGSAWRFALRVQIAVDPEDKSFTQKRGYLSEDEYIPSWQTAQKNSTTKEYQASPSIWSPEKDKSFGCYNNVMDSTHGHICVLGAEEDCTGIDYCNGRLKPGTSYRIYIRKYTYGGFADSRSLIVTTESWPSSDESSSAGLTAAVVVVTLLLVATVAGFVALRKGYLPGKCPVVLKYNQQNEVPSSVQLNQFGDSKNRPIKVSEFKADFRVHMANSAFGYATEFEKLKKMSPDHPKYTGLQTENKSKNRYINIIPFDHTRVKLLPIEDDEFSDYINASFIPGANWTKEYIACQGPLPGTVNDFWRMIWENEIQVIVMLTQCVERGKTKCEEYWPKDNKGQSYGDLTIKLDHSCKLTHYTIRHFSIILNRKRLRVSQMHYTRWPDMGNPETPDDLIDFARAVRDQPNVSSQHSPLLVHCSAGVGRTGTFITVDRLMHELEQKRSEWIDVLGTVLDLRNSRVSMVQTEDQYVYIHQCVNRIIEDLEKKQSTVEPAGEAIYANT